jgi:hypothetical protein
MENEIDELFFELFIYYKNKSFSKALSSFETAVHAENYAIKYILTQKDVHHVKVYEYRNNIKKLLTTIFKTEKHKKTNE